MISTPPTKVKMAFDLNFIRLRLISMSSGLELNGRRHCRHMTWFDTARFGPPTGVQPPLVPRQFSVCGNCSLSSTLPSHSIDKQIALLQGTPQAAAYSLPKPDAWTS